MSLSSTCVFSPIHLYHIFTIFAYVLVSNRVCDLEIVDRAWAVTREPVTSLLHEHCTWKNPGPIFLACNIFDYQSIEKKKSWKKKDLISLSFKLLLDIYQKKLLYYHENDDGYYIYIYLPIFSYLLYWYIYIFNYIVSISIRRWEEVWSEASTFGRHVLLSDSFCDITCCTIWKVHTNLLSRYSHVDEENWWKTKNDDTSVRWWTSSFESMISYKRVECTIRLSLKFYQCTFSNLYIRWPFMLHGPVSSSLVGCHVSIFDTVSEENEERMLPNGNRSSIIGETDFTGCFLF